VPIARPRIGEDPFNSIRSAARIKGRGRTFVPPLFLGNGGGSLVSHPRQTGTRRAATAIVLDVQLGVTFASRCWFELNSNRAARAASNGGSASIRGDQVIARGYSREDEAGERHSNGIQIRYSNVLLRTGIADRDCPEVQRRR
jgi:hypothetical protein